MPKISIGMPVYNCENTVSQSVKSIISQTYQDWELLIIDDGSMDDTLSIVQSFNDPRIKILSDRKHLGLIKRLNILIDCCDGEYFARMDGDDISYPERLEKQLAFLVENPEIDLIGSSAIVFRQNGHLLGKRFCPSDHEIICRRPFSGFPLIHPTFFGKTKWFRKYKYNQLAIRSEDQDLLLRSYRFSRFSNIPEILLGYREENIDLKKNLKGRYYYSKSIIREFRRQKQYKLLLLGILEKILKTCVDILAIKSGLGYRILKHRAMNVEDEERIKWNNVWNEVQ